MINQVILVGRAGKAPELYTTKTDKKVVKFTVATWENYKDDTQESGWRQETEWHNIVVWGPSAENLSKKVKVGDMVYVQGAIRTRHYEDKDGNTKYITEVVGFAKPIIPKKGQSGSEIPEPAAEQKKDPKPLNPKPESEKPVQGKIIDEDDLPF
jgi:single-strand DNA-binding protein